MCPHDDLGLAAQDDPAEGAALPFPQLRAVGADELAGMARKRPGPVTLQDRQGVFVHSFKCSVCDVEFVLFSWQPHRHGVGRTFCPECGQPTPMLHWLAQASDSIAFRPAGPGMEIFQMSPLLDGPLLEDSVFPAADRYDPPPGPTEPDAHPRGSK